MKGRAAFLLALAGTVFGMSANLHAVAARAPGAWTLAVTLCVAALWLACAALCGGNAVLGAVAPVLPCCLMAISLLGLMPALVSAPAAELAWMLALAPFYGFEAACGGQAAGAATGVAVCALIVFLRLAARRRTLLRGDEDLLALERESAEPSIDPGLAPSLESKAKKLLGLSDPEERLRKAVPH